MRLRINKAFTLLFLEPSEDSDEVKDPNTGERIELEAEDIVETCMRDSDTVADPPVEADGFVFVKTGSIKGWLKQEAAVGYPRPKLVESNFIAACVAAEADTNDDDDVAPFFVCADFLIARAIFETKIKNDGPRASGPGNFGPLAVSKQEWDKFLDERATEADGFLPNGYDSPIDQIWAAAHRIVCDAKEMAALKRQSGIGTEEDPFLPTYLDLFHAYLTGSPGAALAIIDALSVGDDPHLLSDLPAGDLKAGINHLLLEHQSQLFGAAAPASLEEILAKTTERLNADLAAAQILVRTHVPEAVPDIPEEKLIQNGVQDATAPAVNATPVDALVTAGGVLGELIASGEGGYSSFNRGRAGDSKGRIDFTRMTLREIMGRQALPVSHPNRLFAVGKYQIIPSTMRDAVQALGIRPEQTLTNALQEQLFRLYLVGRKRPQIRRYIVGESSDLGAAQLALAREFASVASPITGRSVYDKKGGNSSSITAGQSADALRKERAICGQLIQKQTPAVKAWVALSSIEASTTKADVPIPDQPRGQSKLDINKAVKHLIQNKKPKSTGLCARFVRLALEAGGVKISPHPAEARAYGKVLEKHKFAKVSQANYVPQKGDIAVIQPYPDGNPAGHIAMYTGDHWVSDFEQRDMWAGPGYRSFRPPHAFYRP